MQLFSGAGTFTEYNVTLVKDIREGGIYEQINTDTGGG